MLIAHYKFNENGPTYKIPVKDAEAAKPASVHFSFAEIKAKQDEEFENRMDEYDRMADKCDQHFALEILNPAF